ncbi:uncharacterized protein VTP21DRAFT_1607 [Calcarisporiella thermophila]|uniref:uncharacterized protein n=1 Tax=Calcarisporiella thermophila TaxID=911321 RepID=UPI003744340D
MMHSKFSLALFCLFLLLQVHASPIDSEKRDNNVVLHLLKRLLTTHTVSLGQDPAATPTTSPAPTDATTANGPAGATVTTTVVSVTTLTASPPATTEPVNTAASSSISSGPLQSGAANETAETRQVAQAISVVTLPFGMNITVNITDYTGPQQRTQWDVLFYPNGYAYSTNGVCLAFALGNPPLVKAKGGDPHACIWEGMGSCLTKNYNPCTTGEFFSNRDCNNIKHDKIIASWISLTNPNYRSPPAIFSVNTTSTAITSGPNPILDRSILVAYTFYGDASRTQPPQTKYVCSSIQEGQTWTEVNATGDGSVITVTISEGDKFASALSIVTWAALIMGAWVLGGFL